MASIIRPRVVYDVTRLARDVAVKGWTGKELARRAGVSPMTVSRFLRGARQHPATANKIAAALGHGPRYYMSSLPKEAA